MVFGTDRSTATISATVALGHGTAAYATFTSQMGQSNVTSYGGQIGLNVALSTPAESAWKVYRPNLGLLTP